MLQRPYRNYDYEVMLSCTLCPFKTHGKSFFQRHLMSKHNIKLKGLEDGSPNFQTHLGRVYNDFGLIANVTPDTPPDEKRPEKRVMCDICKNSFRDWKTSRQHRKSCKKKSKRCPPPQTDKPPMPMQCPKCELTFFAQKSLTKHMKFCGKQCQVHCVICPFKSVTFSRIEKHLMGKHNLIGKMTKYKEVDFEQALNNAPYTLHKPVEYDTLPTLEDIESGQIPLKHLKYSDKKLEAAKSKKKKKTFNCSKCKKEFLKQRFLNSHQKVCRMSGC